MIPLPSTASIGAAARTGKTTAPTDRGPAGKGDA